MLFLKKRSIVKKLNLLLIFFLTFSITTTQLFSKGKNINLNLMPVPAQITLTGEKFRLTDSFTLALKGEAGDRLFKGSTRALRRLAGRTGLFFPQDFITKESCSDIADFIIKTNR